LFLLKEQEVSEIIIAARDGNENNVIAIEKIPPKALRFTSQLAKTRDWTHAVNIYCYDRGTKHYSRIILNSL
jgi:hypothetical protein